VTLDPTIRSIPVKLKKIFEPFTIILLAVPQGVVLPKELKLFILSLFSENGI